MFYIDNYVMVYAYVPEHFLSCKELSYLDKLIYIRIVGFCRNDEYNNVCFATNPYFSNLFGVKPKAISVSIKKLKDLGYINVSYIRNEKFIKQRQITLKSNIWHNISNYNILNKEECITSKVKDNNKINYKKNNNKDILKDIISYDTDGVMLWNGKRCESKKVSSEEIKELEELLKDYE